MKRVRAKAPFLSKFLLAAILLHDTHRTVALDVIMSHFCTILRKTKAINTSNSLGLWRLCKLRLWEQPSKLGHKWDRMGLLFLP